MLQERSLELPSAADRVQAWADEHQLDDDFDAELPGGGLRGGAQVSGGARPLCNAVGVYNRCSALDRNYVTF